MNNIICKLIIQSSSMRRLSNFYQTKWTYDVDGYYYMIYLRTHWDKEQRKPMEKPFYVGYVALPRNHPDCGKDMDTLSPDVNGGLTYGDKNVYGWDHVHLSNPLSPEDSVSNALRYFKLREKGDFNDNKKENSREE